MFGQTFSLFSAAAVLDSGWYWIDIEKHKGDFHWGEGDGCAFFSNSCNNPSDFNEFCSVSGETGCTNNYA